MKKKQRLQDMAKNLRNLGMSVRAIAEQLGVSKGSVSVWVRHIKLSAQYKREMERNSADGQKKGLAIRLRNLALIRERNEVFSAQLVKGYLARVQVDDWRLMAASMYWCEGGKTALNNGVKFTNSDPSLMRVFMQALRKGFALDEQRWSATLHVHGYHNDEKQKKFWSELTGIPLSRFSKSYVKSNTAKRIHPDYQGCLAVRYGDAHLVRTLIAIYDSLAHQLNDMGA